MPLWLAGSLLLAAAGADAQAPGPRVLAVAPEGTALRRLVAELEATRFTAEAVPTAAPMEAEARTALLDARQATALIELRDDATVLVVWRERDTGALVVQTLEGTEDVGLLAVRAVERLRASLLETPEREPVAEAAPVAPHPEPPPRVREWTLSLGGVAAGSPDGPGIAGLWRLGAAFRPDRWIAFAAQVEGPLFPVTLSELEGDSDQWLALVRLHARLPMLARDEAVQLWIGAGPAFVLAHSVGRATGGLTSQSGTVVAASIEGSLGVRFCFTPEVALELDTTVGVMPSAIDIQFASRTVATLGQPWLSGALALAFTP